MPHRPSTTVLGDWKQRLWSTSQGNLKAPGNARETLTTTNGTKFSTLVGGTISGNHGTVQRRVLASKARQMQPGGADFKVREIEASGKRSVSSLQGLQRDSEVLYVGTFSSNLDAGRRGKIADVFDVEEEGGPGSDAEEQSGASTRAGGTISRSFSQPDFLAGGMNDEVSEEVMLQRPSGLFDRPMLGSLAFRLVYIITLCHSKLL